MGIVKESDKISGAIYNIQANPSSTLALMTKRIANTLSLFSNMEMYRNQLPNICSLVCVWPLVTICKHCQKYVNEFTFRLNEGNCECDT